MKANNATLLIVPATISFFSMLLKISIVKYS